jgi:predicted small secreted protein
MRKLGMLALILALSACNTVAGAGQDITNGAYKVGGWFN